MPRLTTGGPELPLGRSARSTRKTKPSSVVSPISAYSRLATRRKYSWRAGPGGRPVGLAVVLVDVDQVDVGRHVELARAELAHADDPEVDALRRRRARHAVAFVGVGQACASASSSVASARSVMAPVTVSSARPAPRRAPPAAPAPAGAPRARPTAASRPARCRRCTSAVIRRRRERPAAAAAASPRSGAERAARSGCGPPAR
jgi:hypothetical protein